MALWLPLHIMSSAVASSPCLWRICSSFTGNQRILGASVAFARKQSFWRGSQFGHAERINLYGELWGLLSAAQELKAVGMESVCGVSSQGGAQQQAASEPEGDLGPCSAGREMGTAPALLLTRTCMAARPRRGWEERAEGCVCTHTRRIFR